MKSRIKKVLFWVIPCITLVSSIIYIGIAINQHKAYAIKKTESIKAIAKLIQ